MKTIICWLVFGLVLAGASSTAQAASTWLEIDSPHFTLISSDNEGRTRDIAAQFEQIRGVVARLWPWAKVDTDRPVMILCVADEDGMNRLAPPDWKRGGSVRLTSVFASAPERYYIALRSDMRAGDQEGINPYYDAYWSYLSLALGSSIDVRLPTWLASGVVGVMANTLVRANEVQVGRVLPAHLRALRQATRLPLRQLVVADSQSPWYADPNRRFAFDAESTLLLHMLLFGDEHNQQADRLDAFIKRLMEGKSAAGAFEESFGSPDALENGFASYFTRPILTFRRVPADLRVTQDRWPARRLSVAEASTAVAAYHVATERFVDAAAEIRQAREADATLTMTSDVEGMLLERTNESEKARLAFEKAVEAGSTNFYTYYRLAEMMSSPDASRATVARTETLLERSIALNDAFPRAQSRLSEVKAELGKADEAVELARTAVAMTPNAFGAHYALARALATGDRFADAVREARRAATLADDEQQKQAAATRRQRITAAAIAHVPPLAKPLPPPAGAVHVGGPVKPPVKTKDVRAVYPDIAAAAEVQGVVIIEATIGANGKVVQATVLRSIPLLDAAAIEAVRQWEFEPTVVDAVAVPLILTVTVNFALQ
jgi:TonB family protein